MKVLISKADVNRKLAEELGPVLGISLDHWKDFYKITASITPSGVRRGVWTLSQRMTQQEGGPEDEFRFDDLGPDQVKAFWTWLAPHLQCSPDAQAKQVCMEMTTGCPIRIVVEFFLMGE